MRSTVVFTFFLTAVACGQSASAVPITTFDANVSEWSSTTLPSPTVIPIGGMGQVNGNFTLTTEPAISGFQVAMRAVERFSPTPLPNVGSTYTAQAGESAPGLSAWNYDIHIDMRGTALSFQDFNIELTTNIPNHSVVDLQNSLETLGSLPSGTLNGVQLFQTSVNPGFFLSGVDPFAAGTYTFDLQLVPRSDLVPAPQMGASISVVVVPEPTAASLAGLAVAGTVLMRRRR